MEAISTLYYYAAATAALQMNRLRQRGSGLIRPSHLTAVRREPPGGLLQRIARL